MRTTHTEKPTCFAWLLAKYGATLTADEVAETLRINRKDVWLLSTKKLLTPLGTVTPLCTKWFATIAVAELLEDAEWLNRARRIIQRSNAERYKKRQEAA
tara:strand:+ start:1766 stop:2065 length:300 start_codon:yes stop_codon:yes gene_type:complete